VELNRRNDVCECAEPMTKKGVISDLEAACGLLEERMTGLEKLLHLQLKPDQPQPCEVTGEQKKDDDVSETGKRLKDVGEFMLTVVARIDVLRRRVDTL